VIDGDTIDVRADGRIERVRLYGVDTWELSARGGPAARQFLSDSIHGCAVGRERWCNKSPGWVYLETGPRRTDPYGRSLYYVWIESACCGPDLFPGRSPLVDQVLVWEGHGECWRRDGQ
jgi:endonuclease YncB( thermonuclease family)